VMLQPHLLVQTVLLCDGVYYLTKHVNLKVCVKMVDSFVYHTINEFPKWDLTTHILHTMTISTHHCIFFRKFRHITARIFSLTSSVPVYRPPSYEQIFLIETANVLSQNNFRFIYGEN
jgi:hypothetical protein